MELDGLSFYSNTEQNKISVLLEANDAFCMHSIACAIACNKPQTRTRIQRPAPGSPPRERAAAPKETARQTSKIKG
jgi:hypothetical protein